MTKYLDGGASTRYMRCYKPLPAAQGMGIWQDRAFVLYDTGVCGVFDLQSRDPKPVSVFPLGSYNAGKPSRDYLNHANSCMFGAAHRKGNPIPLLYVTVGTGTGADADGYYYRCAVENITERADGSFHSETVQVICYRPEGELPQGRDKWLPSGRPETEHGLQSVLIQGRERSFPFLMQKHRKSDLM